MSSKDLPELSVIDIAKNMRPTLSTGDCVICASSNVRLVECYHSKCTDVNGKKNTACVSCTERYIQEQCARDPHCMFDRNHKFEQKFLNQNLSVAWIKGTLVKKRAEHLSQDQAAELHKLQHVARVYKELMQIYDPERQRPCEEVAQDLKDAVRTVYHTETTLVMEQYKKRKLESEFDAIRNKKKRCGSDILARAKIKALDQDKGSAMVERKMKNELMEIDRRLEKFRSESTAFDPRRAEEPQRAEEPVKKKVEPERLLCSCPANSCNGFAMIQKTKRTGLAQCMMCETLVCIACHKVSTESHECDPDDLKSIRLIKETTKNCPWEGCGAAISKISGCHQMFCTKCKRGFYWDTLRKVMPGDAFHNPHHAEHVGANRLNIGGYDSDPEPEGECCLARPMSWGRQLDRNIRTEMEINGRKFTREDIRQILVNVNHANAEFHARGHNYFKMDFSTDFEHANVKHVAGHTDHDEWISELGRVDNRQKFSRDVYSNVTTLVHATWDAFRDIRRLAMALAPGPHGNFDRTVKERLEELDRLRITQNTELVKVSKEHNDRNYPNFDKKFRLCDMKHKVEKKIDEEAHGIVPRAPKGPKGSNESYDLFG